MNKKPKSTRKPANPKSTGGGGFNFEDKTVAFFLLSMLDEYTPFGPDLGFPIEVSFQLDKSKWHLDDLLITLNTKYKELPEDIFRVAVSVKSNQQFTSQGAPLDFVSDLWHQFLKINSGEFNPTTDRLALVTSALDASYKLSLDEIINSSISATPQKVHSRFTSAGQSNVTTRAIYKSFFCPESIAKEQGITPTDTGNLLQHFRHLNFDWENTASTSINHAIQRCQAVLERGDPAEAPQLWETICRIASDNRPVAGTVTREKLIQELRKNFRLKSYPELRHDWEVIDRYCTNNVECIEDTIGDKVRIARNDIIDEIDSKLDNKYLVLLTGRSGIGKSVAARQWYESKILSHKTVLWFSANSFDCTNLIAFEQTLGIHNPLKKLLSNIPNSPVYIVIDGLDRIYNPSSISTCEQFIKLLQLEDSATPFRLVLTSQSQELEKVQKILLHANCGRKFCDEVFCSPLTQEQLEPVLLAYPSLRKLFFDRRTQVVMENLKLLSVLIDNILLLNETEATQWVGETQIIDWYWKDVIGKTENGDAWSLVLWKIAIMQADTMQTSLPLDAFNVNEVTLCGQLKQNRILRKLQNDHYEFDHDIYGDWFRYRLLKSKQTQVVEYLKERIQSPLWHRAIRLLGISLLESDSTSQEWISKIEQFDNASNTLGSNLLLEAIVFSANPHLLFERTESLLLRDDCKLLRRLLKRFLISATIPDPLKVELAKQFQIPETEVEADYRIPLIIYWPSLLIFLRKHLTQIVSILPEELSDIAAMWLDTNIDFFRKETAEIALTLAEVLAHHKEDHHSSVYYFRKKIYQLMFRAASVFPEEICRLGLQFAERTTEIENEIVEVRTRGGFHSSIPRGPKPDPWPKGPRNRIDKEFRDVILSQRTLIPLFSNKPDAAIEIALSCLIKAPEPFSYRIHDLAEGDLEIEKQLNWISPDYSTGPFLSLLIDNFTSGFELVNQIVEFATDRIFDRIHREVMSQAGFDSQNQETPVDFTHYYPPLIELALPSGGKNYRGGVHVIGWTAGVSHNPPYAVTAALMALEKYFYYRLEKKDSVNDELTYVLEHANSAAFLQVLVYIGKYKSDLFQDVLQPLLAVPELYFWDIDLSLKGYRHFTMFSYKELPKYAIEFWNMPHRSYLLETIGQQLLFSSQPIRELFKTVVPEWGRKKSVTNEEVFRSYLEKLSIMYNIDNWTVVERPDDLIEFRNATLTEFSKQAETHIEENNLSLEFVSFPINCRRILDSEKVLSTDELESFWLQLRRLSDIDPNEFPTDLHGSVENLVCGGIAVLFVKHQEWIKTKSERYQWCLEKLLSIFSNPPKRGEFDFPDSIGDFYWDKFAVEALAVIWADEPENLQYRELIAQQVIDPIHYESQERMFLRSAQFRNRLKENLGQLRRLLFHIAYVKQRYFFVERLNGHYEKKLADSYLPFKVILETWSKEKVASFINGTIPSTWKSWEEMDDQVAFQEIDLLMSEKRRHYEIDWGLIRRSHSWMSIDDRFLEASERTIRIEFWKEALRNLIKTIPVGDLRQRTSHRWSEVETWFVRRFGLIVPYLSTKDRPEEFWQPIIALASTVDHFADEFFDSMWRESLLNEKLPSYFQINHLSIFNHILALPHDTEHRWWFRYHQNWCALAGLYRSFGSGAFHCWESRHQSLVKLQIDFWERWVKEAPSDGGWIAPFATWLQLDAARPIRIKSIEWLFEKIDHNINKIDYHDRDQAVQSLSIYLGSIWSEYAEVIRRDLPIRKAYLGLLDALIAVDDKTAQSLASKIGSDD